MTALIVIVVLIIAYVVTVSTYMVYRRRIAERVWVFQDPSEGQLHRSRGETRAV